jgi:hypothetical protein
MSIRCLARLRRSVGRRRIWRGFPWNCQATTRGSRSLLFGSSRIKPTGVFLAFLPLLAGRFRWREAAAIVAGASAIAVKAFLALAAVGALGQFYMAMTVGAPIYTNIQSHSIAALVSALAWTLPLKGVRWGFALAGLLGLGYVQRPRAPVIMGLTVFGVIHFWYSGTGTRTMSIPFLAGICCLGGVEPPANSSAGSASSYRADYLIRHEGRPCSRACANARSASLDGNGSRRRHRGIIDFLTSSGARVQLLDADSPAFLAMARAGMRQATPQFQWFFAASWAGCLAHTAP